MTLTCKRRHRACHLPPAEIAGDKRWDDIAQVWLGGIVEDISFNNANRYFGFKA